MAKLHELRVYLAEPDKLAALLERWERHYREIFEEYETILHYWVAHPVNADTPTGVALLLEHEDRAAADRTFLQVKTDPRMETADGPQGSSLVTGWERTFLYPVLDDQ